MNLEKVLNVKSVSLFRAKFVKIVLNKEAVTGDFAPAQNNSYFLILEIFYQVRLLKEMYPPS